MNPLAIINDKLLAMWAGFLGSLPNLVAGILVLAAFYVGSRLATRGIRRVFGSRGRDDLGQVLSTTARSAILLFGFLVVASIIFPSIKPADVLTALGFGSVAIGFAFKDILQNWVAGLLILLRQPFARGDQIRVKDFEGTVEAIDSRATFIRTYDSRRVIIPNTDVYTSPVVVMTAFDPRRDQYDIGVGYGDDVEATCKVLLDAVMALDSVIKDPAPEAIPWELAGSSVNIRLRWWSKPHRAELVQTRGAVIAAVKQAAAKAGFDLPFPTQVVLWHDQTEETDGDRTRQREGWPAGPHPPRPARSTLPQAVP